jgi:hypothetical protein
MTTARSSQVDLTVTSFYHVCARCVRRAFLCGDDETTGKNFDHRKLWLLERVRLLATIFAIDVYAYAIMSNHYRLNPVRAGIAQGLDDSSWTSIRQRIEHGMERFARMPSRQGPRWPASPVEGHTRLCLVTPDGCRDATIPFPDIPWRH